MIKLSFTLRILVINFVIIALPLLINSFIFFQNSYYHSIQDAKGKLKELANFRAYTMEEILPAKQVLLKELDYLLKLEDLNTLDIEKLNQQLVFLAHKMEDIHLFIFKPVSDVDFHVLATSYPGLYPTFFKSYILLDRILKTGEGSFIRFIYSAPSGKYIPYLFLGREIKSNTNQSLGILMMATEMKGELGSILSKSQKNQNIDFAILSYDGVVMESTVPSLIGQLFDPVTSERRDEIIHSDNLGDIKIAKNSLSIIQGTDPPFFEFIFNDEIQIAYRSYVSHMGLSIVAFSSKEEFFGKAISHFLLIYSIYGFVLIMGGGFTYWLAIWISRPLRQLTQIMGEVNKGNLNVRFKEEPLGFEINLLGRMFNNTLDILLENIQSAEDEKVKKEIYEKELAIAQKVQKGLLSIEIPQMEGLDSAGAFIPVKEPGGDFYTFFSKNLKDGQQALFFGVTDAAGKGISSCLYAVSFRSLLMSYTSLYDDVGVALSKTNNAFVDDAADSGMFVKALQGVFYPKNKVLFYYSCGNIPGIVRRHNGHLMSLEHSGMAVGLKESNGYRPDEIQLLSGDFVIFFTDGLIEASNSKHQFFSERRLKNILQSRNWETAQQMIEDIKNEIRDFIKDTQQDQEMTFVVLHIK